jgi:adenine deaminase
MEEKSFTVNGNIVDVVGKRIFKGSILVANGIIKKITENDTESEKYILPGFIDAHIHIESSMLIPSEFARIAIVHGTVATVSDPHEIANVLGIPGIKFMIRNGNKVPFKFYFGASPCVPATPFETAGASIGVSEIADLLSMPEIKYLSEMMNFPGVLSRDKDVMAKIAAAQKMGKPIDGHAPGMGGDDLKNYIAAGISTDHECFSLEEALNKIKAGMKVLIRGGSAARDFEELCTLIDEFPDMVMLCSDDKQTDHLIEGHINQLIKAALRTGSDLINVLRSCSLNPVQHYHLDVGLLQTGDPADFVVVDNLSEFNILQTYVNGLLVAEHGNSNIAAVEETPFNNFNIVPIAIPDISVPLQPGKLQVITTREGHLVTGVLEAEPLVRDGFVIGNPETDVLKLVVKNRYNEAPAGLGFVNGFGLKRGAIASSVAHDSHNIIATGTDDESICRAINMIIKEKGGLALVDSDVEETLPLPFAGIMTVENGYEVAIKYKRMVRLVNAMGSRLDAPFMTLSFMALLVIPDLKLSDKGLFDGKKFAFTDLFKI